MNNRAKNYIIKGLVIVGFVFGAGIFPGVLFSEAFGIDGEKWFTGFTIAFLLDGGALMILLPILGLKQKQVKPQKLSIDFSEFSEVVTYFMQILPKYQYENAQTYSANNIEWFIFTRKKFLSLDCFLVIHTDILTDNALSEMNQIFNNFLCAYYHNNIITDYVSVTSLVCVNRVSPSFYKFVNCENQNSFKETNFHAGISFGGKTLYLQNIKDGLVISKSKKLQNELLDLIKHVNQGTDL